MQKNKNIKIIGAALGWGAQLHETEWGPEIYGHCDKIIYPTVRYQPSLRLDYPERLAQIIELNQKLALEVKQQTQLDRFCVVVGGDHTIAIGTWSGTIAALDAEQQFGLLWLDAHMDANTPETSPSHAIHGMPLAILLGYGEPALVNLRHAGAKILPEHMVLFGVRTFDSGEAVLLASLKVRIYFMEEIRDRGVETCLQEAIQLVNKAPKGFGISIDLDVFDPIEAPGVGSPEPNGIFSDGLLSELKQAFCHPNFKALEIAEYNPTRDTDRKTTTLMQKIVDLL